MNSDDKSLKEHFIKRITGSIVWNSRVAFAVLRRGGLRKRFIQLSTGLMMIFAIFNTVFNWNTAMENSGDPLSYHDG